MRSSQGQVSLVSLMTQGGRRAHGTIQSTNNHQKAGFRPYRYMTPVPGSGNRWPLGPYPRAAGAAGRSMEAALRSL